MTRATSAADTVRRDGLHLGYAVGTGEPVSIPVRHMVVTGQTQQAGKTTTMEALIARAGLRAVAFVTKRGEASFAKARRLPPYFKERADWQFIASVLEATMREKLKFDRPWIMRSTHGQTTLAGVHENVKRLMAGAKKDMDRDRFMVLDEYLKIVVPRVAKVKWATSVDLAPGLNVVDLSDRDRFPSELQALVIRSVIEWVYEHELGVVTIIPEAWEFLPQGRGSPVKLAAIELMRKGAALHNVVWLDSQDIGGVDKEPLRQVPVWLLGVQRETNEIERTLANIPASVAKPTKAEVATLELGQFYACYGKVAVKTYVQPAWMDDDTAVKWARGELPPEDRFVQFARGLSAFTRPVIEEDPSMCQEHQRLERELEQLRGSDAKKTADIAHLEKQNERLGESRQVCLLLTQAFAMLGYGPGGGVPAPFDVARMTDAVVERVLARIPASGAVVQVVPAAKLRADFQRDEVARILDTVASFDPLKRRVLKLLEALEGGCITQKQIAERLGRSTGGGSWITLTTAVKEIAAQGFAEIDPKKGPRTATRAKIASDLAAYQPTEQDIEATYQNVLRAIATEGE